MKYRIAQILSEKTLGTAGTEVIDIDVQDPISQLLFEYKSTRVSNTNAGHVAGNLTKIELVDGADVLFSLSGKQMQALDYYDQVKVPYSFRTNAIGVMELLTLNYNFGRKLWDPLLALDTKRFRNPQLKITHNPAVNDGSATAHTLKVLGMIFDEKQVSPTGFLMSKEIKSYTAGADGSYEYTDLPLDHPLRKLLIYAYDDAYFPWQVANEIRLSENNDRRVPIDEKISTLMKWVNSHYPKFVEELYAVLTTVISDHYVTPGFDTEVFGGADGVAGAVGVEAGTLHSPCGLYGAGSYNYRLQVSGFNPHSVVPVLFGDQADPEDWYDVTTLGNLKARIKAGGAGTAGAIALFAQQFRRY